MVSPSSLPWESLPIPWRRSEGCHYYYEKRKGRTKVPLWPLVVVDGGQSPTDPAFHLESPVYTTPRYNSLPPYGQAGDRPSDRRPTPYLFYNVKRRRGRWPSSPSDQEKGGSVRPSGERWTADISREEKGARSSHQTFKILPLKRGG